MFDDLNDTNILLYAAKCYDKPNCIDSEFDEDYKKIRYIKRLLHRYRLTDSIKERLILNHLIILRIGAEVGVVMASKLKNQRSNLARKHLMINPSYNSI